MIFCWKFNVQDLFQLFSVESVYFLFFGESQCLCATVVLQYGFHKGLIEFYFGGGFDFISYHPHVVKLVEGCGGELFSSFYILQITNE